MKNKIAKLPKTNCNARFVFKVPKNIANVNKPHIKKYAAKAVLDAAPMPVKIVVLGNKMSSTRDHQKNPYEEKATMPNVLPFLNSIYPTMTCAKPP
jgi:hypothetical protein